MKLDDIVKKGESAAIHFWRVIPQLVFMWHCPSSNFEESSPNTCGTFYWVQYNFISNNTSMEKFWFIIY